VLFEAVLEANHRAASDDQQVVLEQVPALKKAMSKDDDKGK
jgi:hypothetical protein